MPAPEDDNQKPCFVQTSQGFSVSYKNHYLYSKYNPSKTILQTIANLKILPGTIFLCFSPVLGYGLCELIDKLESDCLIFLIEADSDLFDFAKAKINFKSYEDVVFFVSQKELNDFPLKLYDFAQSGKYKRVVRIDFSAGIQFFSKFYDEFTQACANSIATFWKNRLTLVKFGRRYSYDFFVNLRDLTKTVPIARFFKKIRKPILVLGAGQSVDLLFRNETLDFSKFFVICADTALQPLLKRNVFADAVFIEEAQSVILKAFIGVPKNKNIRFFAGLSSVPYLAQNASAENLSFFTTLYANSSFIKRFCEFSGMPPINAPFGSVGLTAFYYALKFRENENIPIFFAGLDFSYSKGFTHAKGTMAHTQRMLRHDRLTPIENFAASFGDRVIKIKDKNNDDFFTTPILKSYADLFDSLFADEKNVFDVSECGISLGVRRISTEEMRQKISDINYNAKSDKAQEQTPDFFTENQKKELSALLQKEKSELTELKKLLTEKTDFSKDELEQKITELARQKEYLFLHFPDGYSFKCEQSFLNRVRTEIDFFLKAF